MKNKAFIEEKIEFYNLMSLIFMKEPTAEFSSVLAGILSEEYFPLVTDDEMMEDIHNQIRAAILQANPVNFGEILKSEYYMLFFDPHEIKASPWQSSYTNKDHLLYQAPNSHSKRFYRKYHYKVQNDHLPGDHISIQLSFMKILAEKEMELIDEDKSEELKDVQKDIIRFIDDHLLSWIDCFINNLNENNSFYYYKFASMIRAAGRLEKKYWETCLEDKMKGEKQNEC